MHPGKKPQPAPELRPEFLASFGRRLGRKLGEHKQALIDDFLPLVEAVPPADGQALDSSALFGREAELWVELGFGGGEHLYALAEANPQVNFIGGEPFLNGVVALLARMKRKALAVAPGDVQAGAAASNIRVVADDIRPVLRALPDGSVARIYVLFPDPWPKARHHKRRIISQEFLEEVERLLPAGGILQLATDHYDYSIWMFEQLFQRPRLKWNATRVQDWHNPPEGWVPTRYETKTRAEGRQPVYLRFVRQ